MISHDAKIESDIYAYLSLKNSKLINEILIKPKIETFFSEKNISKYEPISAKNSLSDIDFSKKDFSYFYEKILFDIQKSSEDIELTVKYCITFDKENCKKECTSTNTKYDTITLYSDPILYFIYINVDEIFMTLRSLTNTPHSEQI